MLNIAISLATDDDIEDEDQRIMVFIASLEGLR